MAIGIRTKIEDVDVAAWNDRGLKGNHDMFIGAYARNNKKTAEAGQLQILVGGQTAARLEFPAGAQDVMTLDLPEVERRLADTGVRVLDVEVFRLTPDTRVEQWAGVLEISARLQATELLVHGADPDEARLIETFGRLCELAGRYGLRANLEPMPWVDVSNIASALRVLRSAGRANGGLLVDAIHFFRAGDSLAELARVPRGYLHYVQLCDARAERRGVRIGTSRRRKRNCRSGRWRDRVRWWRGEIL